MDKCEVEDEVDNNGNVVDDETRRIIECLAEETHRIALTETHRQELRREFHRNVIWNFRNHIVGNRDPIALVASDRDGHSVSVLVSCNFNSAPELVLRLPELVHHGGEDTDTTGNTTDEEDDEADGEDEDDEDNNSDEVDGEDDDDSDFDSVPSLETAPSSSDDSHLL